MTGIGPVRAKRITDAWVDVDPERLGRLLRNSAKELKSRGAKALYETFMDAAKGSMPEDRAKLLFAAVIGVNMLSRVAGDARWVAALRRSVKDAAAE